MKKNNIIYGMLILFLSLSSCIKNDEIVLKESLVEFDASTHNANALSKAYPVIRQIAPYGFAIPSGAVIISRTSGTIQLRINLVAPQSASDREINYKIVPNETFTQVISGVSRTAQPAVKEVNFTTSGKVTIPANSSFGLLTVNIINPGTALPNDLLLVLEIEGNMELKPSNADKQIGIWINRG